MKYQRFYLVNSSNSAKYIKLDSELPFSIAEGKDTIKKSYPDAQSIMHISPKKAKLFLQLSNVL